MKIIIETTGENKTFDPILDRKKLARKFTKEANNIPINDVDGNNLTVSGRHHYFRWLGKWKTAPGSYQASTRCINLGKDWGKHIKAPSGMALRWDNLGLVVIRKSDGMDYHPTQADCESRDFRGRVRQAMVENYTRRVAARNLEREQKAAQELFKRESANTRVTLYDSRRAGNCVEGSLKFAETKLHVNRDEIMDAPWLMTFPANLLRRVANGNAGQVEAAIRMAFARETMVAI